jgi:hypothetical protein
MDVSEQEFEAAGARMGALREAGHVTEAFYDPEADRVVVVLSTGVELAFPPALAEGLAGASAEDLGSIEVSPSGLGLHWPKLDADLYVPALLQGVLGTRRWMAAELGRGGRARSQPCQGRRSPRERPQGRTATSAGERLNARHPRRLPTQKPPQEAPQGPGRRRPRGRLAGPVGGRRGISEHSNPHEFPSPCSGVQAGCPGLLAKRPYSERSPSPAQSA